MPAVSKLAVPMRSVGYLPLRGSSVGERSADNREGAGSNPAPGPTFIATGMEQDNVTGDQIRVNPAFAGWQVAKALLTAEEHGDAATRERARARVDKWTSVLESILSGTTDVGSRTPVRGIPSWATLEVVTGGFATGALQAGGPLLEHERRLLQILGPVETGEERLTLNRYFLSDDGLRDLSQRLAAENYEVSVPEEGALLIVAWLVQHGMPDAARELVEHIAPFFHTLRFYPAPVTHARSSGARVFLQDVGTTITSLQAVRPNLRILAQKEALTVWIPLYDRTVSLFLETVDGATPDLARDGSGKPLPVQDGKFPVVGGWPCQQYPEGWAARAQSLLREYAVLRQQHALSGKPEDRGESFAQLRDYLRRCIADAKSLTGRDVGRIRLILARYVAKHGGPGSDSWRAVRAAQAAQAATPSYKDLSSALVRRLDAFPRDLGLEDVESALVPISPTESAAHNIPVGIAMPNSLRRKVQRSLWDTPPVLVERGIVTSGETLARVLPQITAQIRAAGIVDPALRSLYSAVYRAFRRRRSLLLLDLQSQVRIEELPWVAAIEPFRQGDLSAREAARAALRETVILTIRSFPHMIIPNKLLQEFQALAKDAGLRIPLVEEVAADIFMGLFSSKFVRAAKEAAWLEGSLYARYYAIDYSEIRALPGEQPAPPWRGRPPDASLLAKICANRAGVIGGVWTVATNGMVIEQEQILTTHNLAALFHSLELRPQINDGELIELARRCFAWVCSRLQLKTVRWHARLIAVKTCAYAWRQMVFYLALLDDETSLSFIRWASEYLVSQREEFRTRFAPALAGLEVAATGHILDEAALQSNSARRFLGWSNTRHWLLESETEATSL